MTAIRWALAILAVGLGIALGWVTDWGRDFGAEPELLRNKAAAKADAGTLLPDFKLSAESGAYAQVSERPLLNPTRRPAPTQPIALIAPEPPRPQIRRGLYQLVGVSDLGGLKLAQVKEIAGGKVRTIKVGDQLQELSVKSIGKEDVVLAFQGETDVLQLAKYTASGRVPAPAPVQPVQPPSPQPSIPLPPPVASVTPPNPVSPSGVAADGRMVGIAPPTGAQPQPSSATSETTPYVQRPGTSMREVLGIGRNRAPSTPSRNPTQEGATR